MHGSVQNRLPQDGCLHVSSDTAKWIDGPYNEMVAGCKSHSHSMHVNVYSVSKQS